MNQTYAAELVRRLAPDLKGELTVQPILPLQIKLHLERLKLMELIRAASEAKPRSLSPPPKWKHTSPAERERRAGARDRASEFRCLGNSRGEALGTRDRQFPEFSSSKPPSPAVALWNHQSNLTPEVLFCALTAD